MRYFILFFLFFVFSIWGGEPEKVNTPKVEAPKVEIPSNVKAFLDTYDRQMDVEKQKYLNLVLKFQKDLKVKLDNEIKIAEQKGKTELVTILTEKRTQLEENTVEDNFVALGFPGEAKKMNKKMLEDILSSKCWCWEQANRECIIFRNGIIKCWTLQTEMIEEKGVVKEKTTVVETSLSNTKYLIDVEKNLLIFTVYRKGSGTIISLSIKEKELRCISATKDGSPQETGWKYCPLLDSTPYKSVLSSLKK